MKRIDISYGGQWYSIGNRSFDEVRDEISAGLRAGHLWLEVNDGDGQPRPAFLSISPGVPLALVPLPEQQDPPLGGPASALEDDIVPIVPAWTGPTIHADRGEQPPS
ncbi:MULTISPECIES: hypothetical protein [unclassified Microbacterium]|uniref:hypothetical protein n=1 Tax=unclassified Microbacterium TaxID=2609290 RepID=UPI00386BDA2C